MNLTVQTQKKMIYAMLVLSLLTAYSCAHNPRSSTMDPILQSTPKNIETYNEIAVQYNQTLPEIYNKLTPQERVFLYYIYRASLPGNRIYADQKHRDSLELIAMFEHLIKHEKSLLEHDKKSDTTSIKKFIDQAKTFFVYLFTNHGPYFAREHSNEKRSIPKLGLTELTKENLIQALKATGFENAEGRVWQVEKTLFDQAHESTATIPNDLEKSGSNFYSPDFTEQDYQKISPEIRSAINAYFSLETVDGKKTTRIQKYSTSEKYGHELDVSAFWLSQAHELAHKNPELFDTHLTKSLEYLTQFLITGDEELFKQHSIEWLQSSSRIDYNFGFIETYDDPKSRRGSFQAEGTIKTVDMAHVNKLLPSMEQQLPFPIYFKRTSDAPMPNASMNRKVFGMGGLGPLFITAAYCLPNYEEIRAQYGSKQIMYPSDRSLADQLNPELNRKLSYLKKTGNWLKTNDPENKLDNDIWDLQVVLHETIGHGSGKLAQHTFQDGDELKIGGNDYNIGDTLQVTNANITEFLAGFESAIEEMRAEIIALYVSINHIDELASCGLLKDWHKKLTQQALKEQLILHMAGTGLRRVLQQSEGATQIDGDHARANYTIMNYLIDHGGLALIEEQVEHNNDMHTVPGLVIANLDAACERIKELMIEVQRIKSTGDGQAARRLIGTYGIMLRNPKHVEMLQKNRKAIVGNLKVSAILHPKFEPILHEKNNEITDVKACWPTDIFDLYFFDKRNELFKI